MFFMYISTEMNRNTHELLQENDINDLRIKISIVSIYVYLYCIYFSM